MLLQTSRLLCEPPGLPKLKERYPDLEPKSVLPPDAGDLVAATQHR
jgi:hypothetical protein